MKAFLEEIGEQLVKLNRDELKNTLILLPNRRAKLYLNRYLAKEIDEPIWAPQISAVNDFVFENLQIQETPQIELLVKLYDVHKKIEGKNKQSIDQFSSWAELLISDFNEIDLYLAPVDKLFRYLSDAKKIATWELDPEKLTDQERSYIKFYESLESYYNEFRQLLLSENKAYQGMAYRLFSEQLSKTKLTFKRIFIVGFNALSPSEDKIFNQLKEQYNTQVFWDIDKYYFDNPNHEAGLFLRKQLKNQDRKKLSFVNDFWQETTKKINIFGIDGNIAQVKFASQLLQNNIISGEFKEDQTAVILANEDLMIPMINSIPTEIKKFNLTMSYPLRLHSGYELIIRIINLYSDYQFKGEQDSTLSIYHRHLTAFIQHPIIQKYLNLSRKNSTTELIKYLHKNNISKLSLDANFYSAAKLIDNPLEKLFRIIQNVNRDIISVLDVIIEIFETIGNEITKDIDEHFIDHFLEVILSLKSTLSNFDQIERLNTLKRWIQNAINQSPIPFSGEPLEGLQIMGMLETRTLDFKNIILVSTNEGILPKTQAYQSFILFDIKKEYNLPLPIDNDAIVAYHFYRLLQRAENINLIYSRSTSGMHSSEASRFIKQLELEIPEVNKNISIKHHMVKVANKADDKAESIIIDKTDEIIDKIMQLATGNGFSPSSLNTYKKCSYLFYLQKIMKLKKDNEVEENMAYNTQGNIVHETLEDLFKPTKGNSISLDEFEKTLLDVKDIFKNKLDELFGKENTENGRNYLTRKILEQYIENFIKKEKEYLKSNTDTKVIGLEENLSKALNFKILNKDITINFRGSADRIDEIPTAAGTNIRIVDYKTGTVKDSDLRITNFRGTDQWEYMFNDKYDKAFQLMMYAWMYWDKKPENYLLTSGITALKNHSNFYPLSLYKNEIISAENIVRFEEDLIILIQEILNPEVPFTQRESDRACEYCDFRTICMRL